MINKKNPQPIKNYLQIHLFSIDNLKMTLLEMVEFNIFVLKKLMGDMTNYLSVKYPLKTPTIVSQ